MRKLAALAAACWLAACGSPTPRKADGGHPCDSGSCTTTTSCRTDSDCSAGRCKSSVCVIECAVDADCHSAEAICNQRGQCVPRPAGTSSSTASSSGSSSGSATSGSSGTHASSSSSGSHSSSSSSGSHSSASSSSSSASSSGTSGSGTTTSGSSASATSSASSSGAGTTSASAASSSSASSSSGSTTGCSCAILNCGAIGEVCDVASCTCVQTTGAGTTSSSSGTSASSSSSSSASSSGTSGAGTTGTSGTTGTTAGGACLDDSACNPPNTICDTTTTLHCVPGCTFGSCPTGQACDYGTGHCRQATGDGGLDDPCTGFYDCASGDCIYFGGQGKCTEPCSASGECPMGFVCIDYGGGGYCRSAVEVFGTNFVPGSQGVDQACTGRASGATTSDCHTTLYCPASAGQGGKCSDTCGTDSECQLTTQGSSDGWTCIMGVVNSTYREGLCTPPFTVGPSCCSNSDCASGATCQNADCSFFGSGPGNCTINDTGDACNNDSDCKHNFCDFTVASANNGTCTEPCCAWADCRGTTYCEAEFGSSGEVYKICKPYPSGWTKYLGEDCDVANPGGCISNTCLAKDPRNPSAGGYCSTTCCTDSNCGGVAGSKCAPWDNGLRYPDGGYAGFTTYCVKQ